MTTSTLAFDTTHAIDESSALFQRVLESIHQWDRINNGHQTEKRASRRNRFHDSVILVVTPPETAGAEPHTKPKLISFWVYGRNISGNGMSFLVSRVLVPVLASDDTPLVQLDNDVFVTGSQLAVGLQRINEDDFHWLNAKLVRLRRVHETLLEGGVQFLSKMDVSNVPHAD